MEIAIIIATVFNAVAVVSIFIFLKVRLDKLSDRLISTLVDLTKESKEQTERNAELFNSVLKSSNDLRLTLKDELFGGFKGINEKFDSITLRITDSLDKHGMRNREEIEKLINTVEDKLLQISDRVDGRLKEGFENVDRTFKEIIEGIARISEAQRKIEELSGEVVSLQKILDDKKRRGIFGEVKLESILVSVFGEKRELYDIQYPLENGGKRFVVDAVVKTPQMGIIPIDSKFPLENYIRVIQADESEKPRFESLFKANLKKHIDDISNKYIVKGKTSDMAVMFLPAEAIFAYVNAYCGDVIEYARRKGVWIASPTTLMALLATIQVVVRDIKTKKQAKKIQEELLKLSKNFSLYRQRWEKLLKDIDKLHKDANDVGITTKKISEQFNKIEKVEFEENPPELSE